MNLALLLEGLAAALVGAAEVARDWAGELVSEWEGSDNSGSEAYFAVSRELVRLAEAVRSLKLPEA